MGEKFVSCDIDEIVIGEPIPISLYVYLDFRFITFRAAGDMLDRPSFERLELKKVKNLFLHEEDRKKFQDWVEARTPKSDAPPLAEVNREFPRTRDEVKRKTLDIFQSAHPDKLVEQTLLASKKLVAEVMKFPYAVSTLSQLHTFSKGTVDHCMNVSILSTYLAMQMGYSHALILQHVGMGALIHDLGKTKVSISDEDGPETVAAKMKDHPTLGTRILESQDRVPNEVKMIVEQHHECFDGSGYPRKLRSNAIYDLARIVSIANVFDDLVINGAGTLQERQKNAITELDQKLFKKFDPQKLEKSLKILKMGI